MESVTDRMCSSAELVSRLPILALCCFVLRQTRLCPRDSVKRFIGRWNVRWGTTAWRETIGIDNVCSDSYRLSIITAIINMVGCA